VDAERGECVAHLIELEGFDDRDDEFHGLIRLSEWILNSENCAYARTRIGHLLKLSTACRTGDARVCTSFKQMPQKQAR
jgi:hypothetical protein